MTKSISVVEAIKVSIEVAQKAIKVTGQCGKAQVHTEVLNEVAQRLGAKDFRALRAMCDQRTEEKRVLDLSSIKPFSLIQFSSDEMVNSVRYEADSQKIGRWIELSKAAMDVRQLLSFEVWTETPLSRRSTLAVRPAFTKDGEVVLQAEIYDKHMSSSAPCYGGVSLETLLKLVGPNPAEDLDNVSHEYIWNAQRRELYILSDVNHPEDWIDCQTEGMDELIASYDML